MVTQYSFDSIVFGSVFAACFLFFMVLAAYLRSPGAKGRAGERRVRARLQRIFKNTNAQILNDLTLPSQGGTTQIDHVVVCNTGIFVIETKNMSGWIFGGEKDKTWTQVIYRSKTRFQNPLRQNFRHAKTLEDLLGVNPDILRNIVVFVGSAWPKAERPAGVLWSLQALTEFMSSSRLAVLTDAQVFDIAAQIREAALDNTRATRKAHIENLKAETVQKAQQGPPCPRCSGVLIERKARKPGEQFLGCSRFPKCRYSQIAPQIAAPHQASATPVVNLADVRRQASLESGEG